jgi:hypothetical protein
LKKWNGKEPKWYWIIVPIIIALAFLFGFFYPHIDANADEASMNPYGEPFRIRATCYTETGNKCANGSYPVEGLSVAGKDEWLGCVCVMYQCNKDGSFGDFIGYFEFTDTGYGIKVKGSNKGSIQLGKSIDVYRKNMAGVKDWIKQYGDYVYIQVVPAKG